MVQGGSTSYVNRSPVCDNQWDNTSRKAGFEAVQKKEKQRQQAQAQQKYGAWGSTFKNKDHFSSLHHC